MRSFGLFTVLTLALVACGDDGTSGAHDAGPMDGRVGAQCDDGVDNDGDTLTDFRLTGTDPGCSTLGDTSELGTRECDDGIDNDLDSFTDYPDDLQCSSPSDMNEAN